MDKILVLNPATASWIVCTVVYDKLSGAITVTDIEDKSITSTFNVGGTVFVRLDEAYSFRLEHSASGGALSMACLTLTEYDTWIDRFVAAGVARCGSARTQGRTIRKSGWIVKKEKPEPKKRKCFCVLRDSVLNCFEDEEAANAAAKETFSKVDRPKPCTVNIRSFDLWSGVATMTPESHKRVFAVYPEGEQMPFLLQCRDAASFKEWFAALSDACGSGADDTSSTKIFGIPLHAVMNRQGRRPPIPLLMAATVDYLETNAMKHERLFHIAPSVEAQEECENMIEQFDAGLDVRLSRCTDPVAVALLFRSYLEQLPEPLLTFERHQAFMSCFVDGQPVEASVLDEVAALPEDNFVLLKFVCRFFYDLAQHSERNKTTIADYAALFGPIFCRSQDKRATLRTEMIAPLAEMLIRIQRNAPTNIIYKLKDDRKKLCIAVFAYQGRSERELTFAAGTVITVVKKDKSGWWKGGFLCDDDNDECPKGDANKRASQKKQRKSKKMVVGWFPHDFVEDYVPGRNTEVLIKQGLNLQDAAVKSGAVDADVSRIAKQQIQNVARSASEDTNEETNNKTTEKLTEKSSEKSIDKSTDKNDSDSNTDTTDKKPTANEPLRASRAPPLPNHAVAHIVAVEDIENEDEEDDDDDTDVVPPTSSELANVQSPPVQPPVPNPDNTEWLGTGDDTDSDVAGVGKSGDVSLNIAKTSGLKTLKLLLSAELITAQERRQLNRLVLALDENTLAVLEALSDDLPDCAEQLRDLLLDST